MRQNVRSKSSLLRYPASIDDKRGTDYELCVVGTEIENRRSALFGGAFPSHRNHRRDLIAQFLSRETSKHIGDDHTGSDCIDADVLFGEFERDRFGKAFDRVFGRNVDTDLAHAYVPRHAGIVDDGAAAILQHYWDFVTHRIENAPNVDIENAAVFSFGSLIERALPFHD